MKKNAHLLAKAENLQSKVDSIRSMLTARANIAKEYAYVGLRRHEFERIIQEHVYLVSDYQSSQCDDYYNSFSFSIHGSIQVCWKNGLIAGYCSSFGCWANSP